MVKTAQKSDFPWSAIFSVIVYQGSVTTGLPASPDSISCHYVTEDLRGQKCSKALNDLSFRQLKFLEIVGNVQGWTIMCTRLENY